jgi:ribosomal protein S18 acetylase RimI-like enzyme
MKENKICLVLASQADALKLASEHKLAFNDGLLQSLSNNALSKYVYEKILRDQNFECLKILNSGVFAGVLLIKKDTYKKVRFNHFSLIGPLIHAIFKNPSYFFTIISSITRNSVLKSKLSHQPYAEIYIFYIVRNFQNNRIGLSALRTFLKDHQDINIIVETTSTAAINLYTKLGFIKTDIRFKLGKKYSSVLVRNHSNS